MDFLIQVLAWVLKVDSSARSPPTDSRNAGRYPFLIGQEGKGRLIQFEQNLEGVEE
jgi:hypothetical protein